MTQRYGLAQRQTKAGNKTNMLSTCSKNECKATQLHQLLLTEANAPGVEAKTAMTAETKKSFMLLVCCV